MKPKKSTKGTKTAYTAASRASSAYADHMTGGGYLAAAIEQKDATVLTLWYEPLRGKTGLTTSTPLLKLGDIGVRR